MPRQQRCRKICKKPKFTSFFPEGFENTNCKDNCIYLSLDEYEIIRLVDFEKLDHKTAADIMEISRTTASEIYENARGKIAQTLVEGKKLLIQGGNYRFCFGESTNICCKNCKRGQYYEQKNKIIMEAKKYMKIAVTYENGQIFQHFGHTEKFKIFEVADDKILESKIVDTNGQGHGALAGFLKSFRVDTLICGGIGGGAKAALSEAGIKIFGGVTGDADTAVKNFIEGTLEYNPNVQCTHHGHGENHGEHKCGSGNHSCV
ncbi:MAG: DUF134 domain-containing protein [Treponemataceae bacterium]